MKDKILVSENPPSLSVYRFVNDNKSPVLFMMVGLPGSGKSYMANAIEIECNGEIIKPKIHSSDAIREELLHDVNDQEHNKDVFAVLHQRIKDDLRNHNSVIYDATNIDKKQRTAFLNGLNGINCVKVCFLVMTPYELCLEQNRNRERSVPDEVIKRMYLKWSPPFLAEGFDTICLYYNYRNIPRKKYDLRNFFFGETDALHIDQENHHHSYSVGQHCLEAYMYTCNYGSYKPSVKIAALLHDIGKPFTKSRENHRGEKTEDCHYYNHQNCGAYDSFFYTDNICDLHVYEKIYIANLIYYHMLPFTWNNNPAAMEKAKRKLGEELFNDILKLNVADREAH